ncbi:prealbumin-like fold domain-containing protein [Luteimonas sp. e5]
MADSGAGIDSAKAGRVRSRVSVKGVRARRRWPLSRWLHAACLSLGLLAVPAQAEQIYATQGYYDYALGGVGFRRQNSDDTSTSIFRPNSCPNTSEANYWRPQPQSFSVTIPSGQRVEKAFLFWTGSNHAVDTQATVSLNGGPGVSVTGTGKIELVNDRRWYQTTADVTNQLRATAPSGGTINVEVSDVIFRAAANDYWRNSCGAGGGVTLVVVHTTDHTDPGISPRAVVIDDVTVAMRNSTYSGSISGVAAASDTPSARMTMATVEGDAFTNVGERFTLNGQVIPLVWAQGEQDRSTFNGDGDSWEQDSATFNVAPGTTAVSYSLTTGNDLIMPVVMALSWNVRSDYGDAPASYGIARHTPADLDDRATRLGPQIDFEGASQHSVNADGDDSNGIDDENGVASLAPLTVANTQYSVTTACYGGLVDGAPVTGHISGWIDFNRNGVFDANERAVATCPPGASSAQLQWTIAPTQIVAGPTYLRLRTARNAADVQNPTGNALSGEVEDFRMDIAPSVAISKKVFPADDDGLFNFNINGTQVASNQGNGYASGELALYHKRLNDYNGMPGSAQAVTVGNITTGSVTVTVGETGGTNTDLTGYTTTITCRNGAGTQVFSGDLTATTATITLPASVTGATTNGPQQHISCEFVNQTANITVVKNTQGGDGTFEFEASGNAARTFSLTTSGGTATDTIDLRHIYPDTGTETILETVPAGWRLTSKSCTYLAPDGSTGSVGTELAAGVQIPLSRGYQYTCTFENIKDPTLQVVKRVVNDNGGSATVADFNITTDAGTLVFDAGSSSGATTTYTAAALTVQPGSYTLSEAQVPAYQAGQWQCTGPGVTQGGTAHDAGSVTLAAGAVAVCTIVNDDSNAADLEISKQQLNPAGDVVAGGAVEYQLEVTNHGPATVTGAVVKDTPGAGLTCPAGNTVTCSGPGCPASAQTVGTLTGAGITLGTLTANQSVTLTFSCTVQ